MSAIEPGPRAVARRKILQAVNRHILRAHASRSAPRMPQQVRLLSARHIQAAVCIARRKRLVKPELLAAAGFREEERR